ncbi:MAG: class I adenylate-forming enzyme family protein [Desulfobacterales bacterium]
MSSFSPNIIADSFTSCATYNPEGEIIIYNDRRIRWKDLVPRVFKIAQALIRLGVKKNDKVAFMFHNTPEFMEINFGIQVAGAVPCPMNYRFVPGEIEFQANHSDARVFIFDGMWSDTVVPALPNLSNVEHIIGFGKTDADHVIDYEAFVNSGDPEDPGAATAWEDVAVMIYTGGTTGFPKGVMLTYKGHLDMFSMMSAHLIVRTFTMDMPPERKRKMIADSTLPLKPLLGPFYRSPLFRYLMERPNTVKTLQERVGKSIMEPKRLRAGYKQMRKSMYPSMPFFHDAAYANLMMGALTGSVCYVLPKSPKFDPADILRLVEDEQVYSLANVPTGWKKLLTYPYFDTYNVQSIRLVATGGGACPSELKKKILQAFPEAMILDAFGQTEMTPVTSFKIDIDPDQIKDRSVGSSIVDVKVVDENNNEVARGETGEILYRSTTLMKGYYKDDEKTRLAMADGWFKSGDLGYIDETGEIRVIDRKKECINTGGEKVFPLEVEEVISTHSKVDAVCIIGVPDEEWGSRVRGIIKLKPGETATPEEISTFCRGKLAGYKIPKSIVFVDDIPFSPAGKMLRQKVRDAYGR